MLEYYDASMQPVRERLRSTPGILGLLDSQVAAKTLHRFLIEYCALGVQITAPVDGWIRRAGARCREIGLGPLGESLIKHAANEAGHDRMFVQDTHSLAKLYEARYGTMLNVSELLSRPPTHAMRRYIDLHERTIAGPTPFGQVAIELEIEGLSVTLGPALMDQFHRVLGPEIISCLTFIEEHVALDVGHTALNRKMLSRLLVARPDCMDTLTSTGTEALETYIDFMTECFAIAKAAA